MLYVLFFFLHLLILLSLFSQSITCTSSNYFSIYFPQLKRYCFKFLFKSSKYRFVTPFSKKERKKGKQEKQKNKTVGSTNAKKKKEINKKKQKKKKKKKIPNNTIIPKKKKKKKKREV